MAGNTATILIPDISGYTEFMSSTELDHSSHVINTLLDSIVATVGEEYEVSEIEGDAVLLYKKGAASSKKEIIDLCMKIHNAFHYQRKWMQQTNICPCGACQAIINLRLKFVAHYGPVSEIKVNRFTKLSGVEMIVAHRLLKNSIGSDEYLLLTEKLLEQLPDHSDSFEMDWSSSADEFSSIGKVKYDFTLLENIRNSVPDPPPLDIQYHTDNTSFMGLQIDANFRDVYMVVSEIRQRAAWVHGLNSVYPQDTDVYIGSIHHCQFDDFEASISPITLDLSEEGILYAETCRIDEMNISMVYEYVFSRVSDQVCNFSCRILPAEGVTIPEELKTRLFNDLEASASKLKHFSEAMHKSEV